jgi:TPP-dependent pyruvate/acetoin dehydrogenase alpha subunit
MTGKKRPRARRSARAPRRVDASPLRGLSAESSLRLHFELLRARRVEEKLAELYKEQEMRTPTHFSVGQEAVAVGMCAALRSDDVVFSGHRCHAHYLAKGGNLAALVAELYGRESGTARGRGGSVHLSDMSVGMVAASAILAQTIPVAVGSALAFQMDGSSRVAVTFFGDGAVDEGVFHESLNWAAVKRLPVVFVCENNLYATHSPLSVRLPRGTEIYRRARMYEIAAEKLDGNDVYAVYRRAQRAVTQCRRGRGPVFLECTTYRWLEHVGPLDDSERGYRSAREIESWKRRDPVKRSAKALHAAGLANSATFQQLESQIAEEIAKAVAEAKQAPWPDPRDLLRNVY